MLNDFDHSLLGKLGSKKNQDVKKLYSNCKKIIQNGKGYTNFNDCMRERNEVGANGSAHICLW